MEIEIATLPVVFMDYLASLLVDHGPSLEDLRRYQHGGECHP
jgi:hypothetical protein